MAIGTKYKYEHLIVHIHSNIPSRTQYLNMSLRFVLRPSEERNHVNYGWLTTAQTFSFSSRDHNGFGAL